MLVLGIADTCPNFDSPGVLCPRMIFLIYDIYKKFKQQNNCNNIHEFNKNCTKFAIVNSDLMFIHGNIARRI